MGAHSTTHDTLLAIKVIAGILVLVAVAYIGGHRRVLRFQERLGISGVITAGFPFIFLGAVASLPSVGVLTPDVVDQLRPVLHFGLGWLGFLVGTSLDIRLLDQVPKGTAYRIAVEAIGPFTMVGGGCATVMLAFGAAYDDPALWRDAILLGTAAAMTAPRVKSADSLLAQLDELAGVVGLLFITAYFREAPLDGSWALPDTAWVFVSLGIAVAIGMLIFAMIRVPQTNAEFLAIVLGGIAFASGLAGYLRLSPLVICFLAGVLVTNFPNEQRASVVKILRHLERPVHLLFLIVAGAVWEIGDWRGWALVPLFVVGRTLGKFAGNIAAKAEDRRVITPLSSLSIALVVSVASLYHDAGVPWILTAVIGGSIVTEVLVQLSTPNKPAVGDDGLDLEERRALDALDAVDEGEP